MPGSILGLEDTEVKGMKKVTSKQAIKFIRLAWDYRGRASVSGMRMGSARPLT